MKLEQAFNAGFGIASESLKPVKESLVSIPQLQLQDGEVNKAVSAETVSVHEPSTPRLNCRDLVMDDGDCLQEQTNCTTEKNKWEQDGDSKSVETTCDDSGAKTLGEGKTYIRSVKEDLVKEEGDSGDNNCKSESSIPSLARAKDDSHGSHDSADNTVRTSGVQSSHGKVNRKKVKVIFFQYFEKRA